MKYFKISFLPLKYGENCLTVISPFESESEMKYFYKGCEKNIVDYSISNEEDYNIWFENESHKKKYK